MANLLSKGLLQRSGVLSTSYEYRYQIEKITLILQLDKFWHQLVVVRPELRSLHIKCYQRIVALPLKGEMTVFVLSIQYFCRLKHGKQTTRLDKIKCYEKSRLSIILFTHYVTREQVVTFIQCAVNRNAKNIHCMTPESHSCH